MRFKFNLETLLRLRLLEQQQAQRSLSEAMHAMDILEKRIEQTEQERVSVRNYIAPQVGKVQLNLLLDGGRYDLLMRAQIAEFENQKVQLNEEVMRRREVLRQADQQVRQLERLKETAKGRFDQEARARQQKELDEVAVQLHQRQLKS